MEKATKKEPAHVRAVRTKEAKGRAKIVSAIDAWLSDRRMLEAADPTEHGGADAAKGLRDLFTIVRVHGVENEVTS